MELREGIKTGLNLASLSIPRYSRPHTNKQKKWLEVKNTLEKGRDVQKYRC